MYVTCDFIKLLVVKKITCIVLITTFSVIKLQLYEYNVLLNKHSICLDKKLIMYIKLLPMFFDQ